MYMYHLITKCQCLHCLKTTSFTNNYHKIFPFQKYYTAIINLKVTLCLLYAFTLGNLMSPPKFNIWDCSQFLLL